MSKEYSECVYNLWTCFFGKETCEAGYLKCDGFSCPLYTPKKEPKPMTNADRLRAMSDEELARFIANQRGWYCDFKDPSEEEYPKVLSWLQSPVEVDNG